MVERSPEPHPVSLFYFFCFHCFVAASEPRGARTLMSVHGRLLLMPFCISALGRLLAILAKGGSPKKSLARLSLGCSTRHSQFSVVRVSTMCSANPVSDDTRTSCCDPRSRFRCKAAKSIQLVLLCYLAMHCHISCIAPQRLCFVVIRSCVAWFRRHAVSLRL